MAGQIDNELFEKKVGTEYAKLLRGNLRNAIKITTNKRTGQALKSNVVPKIKDGQLYALEMVTPFYIYPILHLGYERSKKQGVSARVQPRNIMGLAVQNGQFTEKLATAIGEVRAVDIANRIANAMDINNKI